jgi:DNA repair exonuclease SbcCD ATPase subunit
MVFGWGKKKVQQVPEEIPQHKEIKLSEVQKITEDLLDLRKTQTVAEIKSIRHQTSPLIKDLENIAKTLEKDNLKVEDIDKHLRIIVVRGKKQVIDVIKKNTEDLPEISSFDDILRLDNVLNQKLKKIGDVLGRQTRVIHIFAKKYAGKLKEILAEMNSNHKEIQKLIKNFQNTKSDSNEITGLLGKIKKLEDDSISKNQQISESQNKLDSFQGEIKNFEDSIEKIKSSEKYDEFLKLNQSLSSFNDAKRKIINEIDTQFTKISRPLSRYEYSSALDKEQKSLLSQLINDPFEALTPKNKDSIIVIFENVRKGIISGSISVKDVEKSMGHLTETEEWLGGFIKKVKDFVEQKTEIQHQLSGFDNSELSTLQTDLEKKLSQKQYKELKISSLRKEIDEDHANIPKMVSEIKNNLKKFSNTDYNIKRPT